MIQGKVVDCTPLIWTSAPSDFATPATPAHGSDHIMSSNSGSASLAPWFRCVKAIAVTAIVAVIGLIILYAVHCHASWEAPLTGMDFDTDADDMIMSERQKSHLGFESAEDLEFESGSMPASSPETPIDLLPPNRYLPPNISEGDLPPEEPQELGMETGIVQWPNALMYYEFDRSLTARARDHFTRAMEHIQQKTCIRFQQSSTQAYRVLVLDGAGCSSYVGMVGPGGAPQKLTLNSICGFGAAVHEILHALGFLHEQSRNDRDAYVDIHVHNIKEIPGGVLHNFRKATRMKSQTAYDYGSIMHYQRNAFAIDITRDTITPKPDRGQVLGQRSGLSDLDTKLLMQLYCGGTSTSDPCKPNPCGSNHECVVDRLHTNGYFCRTKGGPLLLLYPNCGLWDVADLKFYSSTECTGFVPPSSYYVSDTVDVAGYKAENMFDSSPTSIWGGRPRNGECWIVAEFQSYPKCVKVSHVNHWFAQALQVWSLTPTTYEKFELLTDTISCPGTVTVNLN